MHNIDPQMNRNAPAKDTQIAVNLPLTTQNLCVTYAGQQQAALQDISLQIIPGKSYAVVGPNGAGKSTFLKAALGFIPFQSGKVSFFGQDINLVRRKIAYVPQRASIDWDFPISVEEIVLQGLYPDIKKFEFFTPARHKHIVDNALELVGLAEMSKRQISMLSGGQQQRMFIARALAQSMMDNGAELFLLDEPFTGLDAHTEKDLASILKNLVESGKTVLAVHHNLTNVSDYFDSIILLNKTLIGYGDIERIFTDEAVRKTYLPTTIRAV